ncbi:hypothetical protein B0T20DRAFT_317404, partial [Sordaria brevicollis]
GKRYGIAFNRINIVNYRKGELTYYRFKYNQFSQPRLSIAKFKKIRNRKYN